MQVEFKWNVFIFFLFEKFFLLFFYAFLFYSFSRIYKQPPEVFCRKSCFLKISIKKKHQHRCFPMNIAKFHRATTANASYCKKSMDQNAVYCVQSLSDPSRNRKCHWKRYKSTPMSKAISTCQSYIETMSHSSHTNHS